MPSNPTNNSTISLSALQPGGEAGPTLCAFASPLDQPDWDVWLGAFEGATSFHSAGWARSLVEAYGHVPRYLVRTQHGRGQALSPIMECGTWPGRRCGVSLPFTDACSAIASPGNPDSSDLLSAALELGTRRRWSFYQWNTSEVLPGLAPSVAYHAHRINLAPGGDALFAGLEGSTRRAVRKAQASGVVVEFLEGPTAAAEYYRLHCLTRKRHGQPPQPWRFFASLGRNVLTGNRGFVAVARFENRIVAAAMFLVFGTSAAYKFAASDDRFQHCRAGNLVLWEGIRRLVAQGCRSLDLGRTSFDNEGLRRFKLGWGAEERPLYSYRLRIPDRTVIPMRDAAHAWHTGILRQFPVPILRLAGELIYPYRI